MFPAERYANLEFDRLLEQVAGFAGSPLTRTLIREVDVEFHPARVDENLDQTSEALRFMDDHPASGLPPFAQLEDLTDLLERIVAGELVDPMQARILLRFLQVCASFDALREAMPMQRYPRLADLASPWQSLSQLLALTKRIFNEEGDVRDSASPELAELRRRLSRFEGDVGGSVREMLRQIKEHTGEDANLAIRGNRFVVLMPRALVREFQGSIVDVSGSGRSIYFEPAAVASLNTERQHLFLDEDAEVRRLLRDYGHQVAGHYEQLRANLAVLAKYDYIFARALHARAIRGNRPRLNREGRFALRGAVHPLLFKHFVPEDLYFTEEKALIISGVNAGGKTVLLKLLGLYALMSALGCYVPGDAEIPYISALLADIGDDQSTLSNLSTFTAHLRFISDLWDELELRRDVGLPVLVLIDEVGTGTEPGEGAAFAYGLIEALLQHPVKLALTTHYDLLKTLGLERQDVKNVSLAFDQEALKPTFIILDNQPGQSFALAIAKRWGIEPGIVDRAQAVLGTEERKMAAIISELERLRSEAEQFRANAATLSAELERMNRENAALNLELRGSKQRFMEQTEKVKVELERRIDELLDQTKAKLKKKAQQSTRKHDEYVKAASKQAQLGRQQKEQVEGAVKKVLHDLELRPDEILVDEPLQLGDMAAVLDSRVRGRVTEVSAKKGEAVIEVHGKRIEVKLKKLRKVAGPEPKSKDALSAYLPAVSTRKLGLERAYSEGLATSSDTLDLHGQTTEEAQESLDEFINNCLLNGIATIRIMHGIGSGRLRAFVQDYLRRHKLLANVRYAALNDGGVGVTLADLR